MNNTFGKRLKKVRKSKKITQNELAKRSGISAVAISFYEQDHILPGLFALECICTALGCHSSDLIDF